MRKIILLLIFLIFSLFAKSLNVRLIGYYNTPGFADSLFIVNNYAYVADGDSGLRIINISNPQMPLLVGEYFIPNECWEFLFPIFMPILLAVKWE
ncbi:MAG: hypothetical protein ABIK78_06490 [candidate division WOR-3 bacterium]